jgi:hypothetical protein
MVGSQHDALFAVKTASGGRLLFKDPAMVRK